tara:strand:+ start:4898 stop:7048 length:2151 start_codon:yes stop_codon:yes gene_type:complete
MLRNYQLLLLCLNISAILGINKPYIIYTTEEFSFPAEQIAELHNEIIPQISNLPELDTEIIYKEYMSENNFTEYLNTFNYNCQNSDNISDCTSNNNCIWDPNDTCIDSEKYLLIIGDESIINSLSMSNICGNNQFSDDLFNLNFTIGRLIVNNLQEATMQVEKIRNYITNTNSGIWKNQLLLIADDQSNPSNPNSLTEINHTLNTSNIYLELEDKLPINILYGEEFDNQSNLTENIINMINSGTGIINYIGHGTHQSLAHELILNMDRDINLIDTNNKPPIWVIGTCSFGKFINNTCMAEELMRKEDAAIAIISTTDGIPASGNNAYLSDFYNRIGEYIEGENYRLGDVFKKAKLQFENNQCTPYKFQLFGDPALPLLLARRANDLVDIPDSILIGDSNLIELNQDYSNNAYIKIIGPNTIIPIGNSQYAKPGPDLFNSGNFSQLINFYTPIDAIYNSAKLFVLNEDITTINNNLIQTDIDIPLILNIDPNILSDNNGPEITIYFNNMIIQDNSTIYSPFNFKINFSDNLPINLSGYNFHHLAMWIDNNQSNKIILNDYPFIATSDTSGYIELFIEQDFFHQDQHTLSVEGWDILNNYNSESITININNINQNRIFNVLNFPNPFKDKTFFTFQMTNPEPINIHIDILSQTGQKIISFEQYANYSSDYHTIPNYGWNGKDKYNNSLNNGTYFYRLYIQDDEKNTLYNKIHNLTIIK